MKEQLTSNQPCTHDALYAYTYDKRLVPIRCLSCEIERLTAELAHARAEARAMHSAYESSVKLRATDETSAQRTCECEICSIPLVPAPGASHYSGCPYSPLYEPQ